uniref:CTB10 n=1 Tax=Cercospora sp. JNU001 TaxID=2979285 RepID=UPI003CE5C958
MGSIGEPNRLLCFSIYVTKKPDQSEEDHHNHVSKVNAPMMIPFLKKYGIVRYTVKHNDAYSKPKQAALMAGQPEENVLAYDTVFEMIVKDIESIQTMQKDEEFLRTAIPDLFNFADMTRTKGSGTWIEEFTFALEHHHHHH